MSDIARYAKLPIVAIQFLTRIPIFPNMRIESRDLGNCLAFFPFVGAIIAGALGVASYLALEVGLPFGVIATLLLMIEAVITGAFHWDGLADTFDGFYSTHKSREEMLDIMHDSRIGVMGATSIFMVALLQYASITELLGYELEYFLAAIFSSYMFGKWGCVYLSVFSSYGRKEGKGLVFLESSRWPVLLVASILLVPLFILEPRYLLVFFGVMFFLVLWGAYSTRKVGGITGDILGASARLSETLSMVLFIILFHYIL